MTHINETYVERLFYNADELMDRGEYAEAKEMLVELLAEDPTYAMAHNHLGWMYTHKLYNLQRAEEHLKLALKYAVGCSPPYMNYAVMLYEKNDYRLLRKFVDESLEVPGVDVFYFLTLKAATFEVEGLYTQALDVLKVARLHALGEEAVERVKTHRRRLFMKMGRFARVLATLF